MTRAKFYCSKVSQTKDGPRRKSGHRDCVDGCVFRIRGEQETFSIHTQWQYHARYFEPRHGSNVRSGKRLLRGLHTRELDPKLISRTTLSVTSAAVSSAVVANITSLASFICLIRLHSDQLRIYIPTSAAERTIFTAILG